MKKPDAVIFDWDNTLADGWLSITAAMNAARAAYGDDHRPWSEEEAKRNCTRALRDSFPEWFGADWEKARDVFYGTIDKTHLQLLKQIDGADTLLRWIAAQGIPQMIVSNKRGDILRREVEQAGWADLFVSVVGSMDVKIDKPARDPVDLALRDTGLAGETHDIWFVGDKEIDAVCARNAGCRPVLISDAAEAEKAQVPLVFPDCEALLHTLMTCAEIA